MRDLADRPEGPGADPWIDPWADAFAAAALLAVDPRLGGAVIRARPGPARDAWLAAWTAGLDEPPLRLPPGADDAALHGGLDLAATLAAGREVRGTGLLARGRPLALPMAERCSPGLAARLALALDAGALVVALDEGVEDEAAPAALADRLAFRIDLDGLGRPPPLPAIPPTAEARARLAAVAVPDDAAARLVSLAACLGIDGVRAPLLALRAARAAAALAGEALAGEAAVDERAVALAARLVLGPRATRLPAPPDEPDAEPDPEGERQEAPDADDRRGQTVPDEVLLEAARAAIPPGLLARLLAGAAGRRARRAGAGEGAFDLRRGRPAGTVARPPRDGTRIALLDTLRAAAPWQRLRGRAPGDPGRLDVRIGDIRLRRFRRRAERVAIFAVDASGSTALARLAEAKGAIEIMLADAYSGRHSVALVAFRGTGAEILLPPTRSLVAAKRRLAGLPGGGGTPLAAGLEAALALAERARARGLVPTVAVLTDGRANIGRDGAPGRAQAAADAEAAARLLRHSGVATVLIDTGPRPSEPARTLAAAMGGLYLPLPRADARALAGAVAAAAG